jgi:hypothetical protein
MHWDNLMLNVGFCERPRVAFAPSQLKADRTVWDDAAPNMICLARCARLVRVLIPCTMCSRAGERHHRCCSTHPNHPQRSYRAVPDVAPTIDNDSRTLEHCSVGRAGVAFRSTSRYSAPRHGVVASFAVAHETLQIESMKQRETLQRRSISTPKRVRCRCLMLRRHQPPDA